ncbi:hypothetical protein A3A75_04095 [Candidatus Woesebacteria bacterium RIFCSPLOWO2_01_FULL_39_10]|uniref:Uncharacterized protein n=1 Tax=Candidatus Woesebacteria bacterium RIFCSPLOWO2_01_FULL_39_10 TaxID=1802516 RepID=A0A1F8BA43_9BACT|nr:MAG: hypothetical protein A3A75_04095 [Candidatus Woesebacteria bacterium RIFCSPLOWO2_01_FULL_39_10]
MLKALKQQIDDIHAGSTAELPTEFGHAIGVIVQMGRDEALFGEKTAESQINRMRAKAKEEVIKYGSKILDFLRPELRALIEPENLENLEQEHQMFLANKGGERR